MTSFIRQYYPTKPRKTSANSYQSVKIGLSVLFTSVLMGCSSTPPDDYTEDSRNRAEWTKIEETNTLEMKKLNYLARFLATADNRREITAEVYDVDFIERWSANDYGTAAAMTTDLLTGHLVTNLSMGIDLAVSGLVGLYRMVNNGSFDYVTQLWLPETYNGYELRDAESAQIAMMAFTEDRLDHIAATFGYTYECKLGCGEDEYQRNYVFTRSQDESLGDRFIYQPDEFAFFVNLLQPVEVSENDILPLLIGEPLKWKTPEPNAYPHMFMSEFNYNDAGEVKTVVTDEDIALISARRNMIHTEMGRHLMREFHSTPYTISGDDTLYPKQFYHNGGVYRYQTKSNKEFLRWEIDMSPMVNEVGTTQIAP